MRYLEIADALRARVAVGDYGPGGALPSEAELGRQFPASRVTIRRALEELRGEGLVSSRKGSGWFVAVDPLRQALGRFPTVEAAMEAAGRTARREVLDYAFGPAPYPVAEALGVEVDSVVLRVLRLNYADDVPFGIVTVWLPEHLGERVSRLEAEESTFYELLSRLGVALGGATQTITAVLAGEEERKWLGAKAGTPVLVCRRVTRDADGTPVLFSEHRYSAQHTSFEVELPRVAPAGEGPVGLRVAPGAERAEAS